MSCSLGREVQLWTGEADRGPQLYLMDNRGEGRRLPSPNFYGTGGGDGTVDTTGDTGKSNRGRPGRAGGRGSYHGVRVGKKRRDKDHNGGAEAGDGAQGVGSLFYGSAAALGRIRCI